MMVKGSVLFLSYFCVDISSKARASLTQEQNWFESMSSKDSIVMWRILLPVPSSLA